MAQTIVLVRHGRSAHVHPTMLDFDGFLRWRADYEAAGIDDEPPPALKAMASTSGIVVASNARRAIDSAKLLDPSREIETTDLLGELALVPPKIRAIRMPLLGWALAIGLRSMLGTSDAEVQRSRDAVTWLTALADRHGTVLAVTHTSFRELLSKRLLERGWRCEIPARKRDHWSAWTFSR